MKIFLATNNRHKIEEISAILQPAIPGLEITTINDYTNFPKVEEDAPTLQGNALLKAHAGYKETGLLTVADDTGLEVFYLALQPGVFSARYAGPEATYADNNTKLLQAMNGVPPRRRNARFRCAVAIVGKGIEKTAEGQIDGFIRESARGSGGFGYDPLFVPAGYDRTYAELTAEEKNIISHRARAFVQAADMLKGMLL
ncbi:MAG: RdgB/HAM1 family non-canonical purine NTP pyrophosphatase [Ignavibacteriales bacterium]|nr:RdgB/HAM1 family non-canonical purine NTP pyrophosphatase [Ignavibacteriales bacterium]